MCEYYLELKELFNEILRSFPRCQAEEIIQRIICGESVDCAIQSVIDEM